MKRAMNKWIVALLFWTLPVGAVTPAETPEWRALVHYRPELFGGVKSTIDSPAFFLAEDGKTNPESEWRATVALFAGSDTEKQCLFPARYAFLKRQGMAKRPFPVCPEYESFKKDLKPQGITLLFTDAYMNNPASLFGHTLMRIDVPAGKTQLVAHGMNYGAAVPADSNGLLFAVLGLTGGYWGTFTVKPYYNVINTYNNIENRDIWEFHLNLTAAEIDAFVAHLWEVGQTQTRYFFFSENCSYLLMEILDAVRPSLKLADDFPMHAIPLDTLKAVAKRDGLIDGVNYRPSRQKRIEAAYRRLNDEQRVALVAFLERDEEIPAEWPPEQQADVADVAYEYVQYQWEAQKIPLATYRRQSFGLLKKRTALDVVRPAVDITSPSPLTAHDSKRLVLEQGWERGTSFQEVAFRPAYHSLSDRPDGLRAGSEINFLSTRWRYYDKRRKFVLQELELVDLYSVAPWQALFRPVSYQVRSGVRRDWNPATRGEGYVAYLEGGSGISAHMTDGVYAFMFLNSAGEYGGLMPRTAGIGVGPEVGVLAYTSWGQVQADVSRYISNNRFLNRTRARVQGVWNISRNWGVHAGYEITDRRPHSTNTMRFGIRTFF